MGGLKSRMPWTYRSMLAATLAIAGIFPFSGFFSKDEILWKVFDGWYRHGACDGPMLNLAAWIMGMVGAFMTAFYMTRLMVMTFGGTYRGTGDDIFGLRVPSEFGNMHPGHKPHEVVWNMWVPVAILAGLAVVAGFWNIPHSLHWLGGSHFDEWLSPVLFQLLHVHHDSAPALEYGLMAWATLLWVPGAMALAMWFYAWDPSWSRAKAFVARFPNLFRWVHAKYYVDEFYEATLIGPCKQLGAQLWAFDAWVVDGVVNGAARVTLLSARLSHWFDARVVDGAVNLVAWVLQQVSLGFRKLQTGRVQNYALVMFLGFLAFAFYRFLS
jgi:NADH-quinone oxidoreductase subunit L